MESTARHGEVIRGLAVSAGVVVARAFRLDAAPGEPGPMMTDPEDVQRELVRFERASDAAALELAELIERVSGEIGADESRIFQTHLYMVRDRAFVSKVNSAISEHHLPAERALQETAEEYENIFRSITDEYLRERLADLRDVVNRIAGHLAPESTEKTIPFDDPVVLVARELLPSQTLKFGKLRIAGIVTERGSRTSHAAIIARSLGLPAVSGIPELLDRVQTGDQLIVDGREGLLLINPGTEAESAYRKLEREFFNLKDRLIDNRDEPAVTKDGVAVELSANINSVSDAGIAVDVGARSVGLFRTEYLFMLHPSIPDEEEQVAAYRQIIEASPNRTVTIRTLDLGGDKTVPYFPTAREANPFMGWRSIRLSFAHPEFFKRQVRAIFRAATAGNIRILLPMVSTMEEIQQAHERIDEAADELKSAGIEHNSDIPRGIMVEVPAAAVMIDRMARRVDFVSIGSNDLVQYLMAADRDNPKVAYLCDPLQPAVLRLLRYVIESCATTSTPITVCGEMAGRTHAVLALMAFGLRSFSMSPAFVPLIKSLVRTIDIGRLDALRRELMDQGSAGEVRSVLNHVLQQVNPELARLEADMR